MIHVLMQVYNICLIDNMTIIHLKLYKVTYLPNSFRFYRTRPDGFSMQKSPENKYYPLHININILSFWFCYLQYFNIS